MPQLSFSLADTVVVVVCIFIVCWIKNNFESDFFAHSHMCVHVGGYRVVRACVCEHTHNFDLLETHTHMAGIPLATPVLRGMLGRREVPRFEFVVSSAGENFQHIFLDSAACDCVYVCVLF